MAAITLKNYNGALVKSNITLVTCTNPTLEDTFHALYTTYMYTNVSHIGLWQPHAMRTPQARIEHCQQLIDRVVLNEIYEAPVIFTYSETYLLRLKRAIRNSIISPNQVALNVVTVFKQDPSLPTILHIPIEEDGSLELPLPDGYFDWRGEELF